MSPENQKITKVQTNALRHGIAYMCDDKRLARTQVHVSLNLTTYLDLLNHLLRNENRKLEQRNQSFSSFCKH